jgi:hypothetical protein
MHLPSRENRATTILVQQPMHHSTMLIVDDYSNMSFDCVDEYCLTMNHHNNSNTTSDTLESNEERLDIIFLIVCIW